MDARAGHADVEQPPLLVDLGVGARLPGRQLLVVEPRQEDGVELEPLGAVVGEEVDARGLGAAGGEARAQVVREGRPGTVEGLCEPHEPGEVGLADELPLAELVRHDLEQTGVEGEPPDLLGRGAAVEPAQQRARRLPLEQRGALERDLRVVEALLEVGQPGVRAAEHRHLLERAVELADPPDDPGVLVGGARERPHLRLGPGRPGGAERLLGASEQRHEPVREGEHLRRRAVVLLEPDDGRVREPPRRGEQVLGAGAGEGVDRLVVVADDAEVVAVAEPEVEQRLLQQVDVLVLVDGEGGVARAEAVDRRRVALVEAHGLLEQVLEVGQALLGLARLVGAVDPGHQVGRDRRLVPAQLAEVALGPDPAVLRPLDLGREVAGRPELVRRRQAVRRSGAARRPSRRRSGRPPRARSGAAAPAPPSGRWRRGRRSHRGAPAAPAARRRPCR